MLLCALLSLPLATPPSALHAPSTATLPARDPVVGVWKGRARGKGNFLPEHGLPTTFAFERAGSGELGGAVVMQGARMERLKLSLAEGGGELVVKGVVYNMPVVMKLAIEGERMHGSLTGIGVFGDVEMERWREQVLALPEGVSSVADLEALPVESWIEDLRFLEEYLPQVHADAFHKNSKTEWAALVDAAVERMPAMEPAERTLELARIAAAVGDAHTGLVWREGSGFEGLPVWVRRFSDGLFVTGAHEASAELVGARIVRVGNVSVEQAMQAVAAVVSAENDAWRTEQSLALLFVPRLLEILGITEDALAIPLQVETPAGDLLDVRLDADRSTPWVMAPDPKYDPIQKFITNTSQAYWFEPLPEEGAVYVAYNACRQDPKQSMGDFMGQVLESFDEIEARRLVIDLRNNSGGSQLVLGDQLSRLKKHAQIGAPGGLVALIGPQTYSSGMRGAYDLRETVGGRLVGMPTGGRPNSYGEVVQFRLPRSGLRVFHSTKEFRVYPNEEFDSIHPNLRVDMASHEYFAGEDPVLRAALDLAD